jgi:hypothetical protein
MDAGLKPRSTSEANAEAKASAEASAEAEAEAEIEAEAEAEAMQMQKQCKCKCKCKGKCGVLRFAQNDEQRQPRNPSTAQLRCYAQEENFRWRGRKGV